ncbi:MAG: Uma2 family endonuclease [Acidobacteriota bacterium]|nr:Uma2 family endonuclease [Acidobacteriota bacterium]
MSMISAARVTPPVEVDAPPLLCNGDCMNQREFHRRYEAYPENVKFELVGGVVYLVSGVDYMASPLRRPHGKYHLKFSHLLSVYEDATTGVDASDNATQILGEESEPQPDLTLRIMPEYGGQSRVTDDEYYEGPPELIAEIAHSTRALDMNQKRQDYEQAGVLEYLVLCVEERELHWFSFATQKMIRPDRDGIARSRVFPGLWIGVAALLDRDSPRLIETVQKGLSSRAHAAFVRRLEKVRHKQS